MSANLNAEQAAEYLGGDPITATTVKALARRKQIGHIKVGRTTVFPIAALDAYIAEHTIAPVENPWGLTDSSLRHVRDGRATRRSA
jgi:excisionase family DNA binding protein